jgi:hypothetical protein
MTILTVGTGYEFSSISDAVNASASGDTIEIAPGTYPSTNFGFAIIPHSLTIEPIGWAPGDAPSVHLEATTAPSNDKGMFTVGTMGDAPTVTINGIEISGVAIGPSLGDNGAAIRWQSGTLTLNDDWFHDNQDGLLGTPLIPGQGDLTVNDSEFNNNGSGNGQTHGLYVGFAHSVTITDSYFHDTVVGHEIKSRAEINTITGSRIYTDGSVTDTAGTDSMQIDLPNGGIDVVTGDVLEKGPNSENQRFIAFGEGPANGVGTLWPGSSLLVQDDTFVNDYGSRAVAIWNDSGLPVVTAKADELWNIPLASAFSGPLASGSGGNVELPLTPHPTLDYSDPWNEIVCFAAGTHIRTPAGEKLVESLIRGDVVLTLADDQLKPQPVKWIGRRPIDLTKYSQPEKVAPVRIQRGAFADNVPHSDLLLSPDHAIFVDGKLICARQLINGATIRQEKDLPSIEYFHIELVAHAILLAEGLPVESYLNTGNQGFFANSDAPLVLHPDLTDESDYPTREAGSYAPFVWDEANVRPVWQRLATRAAAMGRPVSQHVTTTEPDLRLLATCSKHRDGKPIHRDGNLVLFVLPRGEEQVRLVSRAQSPTEARPWLEDRRKLGVRVKRIVLRGADELREIPVDHPGLTKGWWALERDGQVMSRWTDGDAVLPLLSMAGDVILEIHLAEAMTYVVEGMRGRPRGMAACCWYAARKIVGVIDNSAIPFYNFDAKLLVWAAHAGQQAEPITFGGSIQYGHNDFNLDPALKYDWSTRKLVYFGPDDPHTVKSEFLGF